MYIGYCNKEVDVVKQRPSVGNISQLALLNVTSTRRIFLSAMLSNSSNRHPISNPGQGGDMSTKKGSVLC
jgi:hypothetical protein